MKSYVTYEVEKAIEGIVVRAVGAELPVLECKVFLRNNSMEYVAALLLDVSVDRVMPTHIVIPGRLFTTETPELDTAMRNFLAEASEIIRSNIPEIKIAHAKCLMGCGTTSSILLT